MIEKETEIVTIFTQNSDEKNLYVCYICLKYTKNYVSYRTQFISRVYPK